MNLASYQQLLRNAFVGLAMGYVLSRAGFADYGEVQKMFTLSDWRLICTFAGAVGLAMFVFKLFTDGSAAPHKIFHRGLVPGSVLFGAGWALTGACPAVALVQLGQGQWAAMATLLGMAAGVWLYGLTRGRYFRWDTGACE